MIFCTAGHVDHGKTALVRALTGVDTDRLAEERRRGLTIELGFAPLELPGVGRVSLVDVPGHAQFIPTMLSGCGGLDGALFTVAADEGPMPQTAEHLDILTLLGLERGVVALTRADLASPAARAEVEARTRALTAGTFLEGAPRIFVSAVTGEGLEDLGNAVSALFPAGDPGDAGSLLTDQRQEDAARRALDAVRRALEALETGMTPDAVLTDAEEALDALGELTGRTAKEEIVSRIFSRFCVGK